MLFRSTGNLGVGLTAPTSLLQLARTTSSLGSLIRTDGLSTELNLWRIFTGATLGVQTEKFRLYSEATATPWIGFQSKLNGFKFETGGPNERMRINGISTGNTFNGFTGVDATGFVGISPTSSDWNNQGPRSALHIMEEPGVFQTSGYRPWMRIGTSYNANLDFMYTGLKIITQDITEAVLVFGDNPVSSIFGPDQMVVRCVEGTGTNSVGSNSPDGLELMRFNGAGIGSVGVGDEFSHVSNDFQPQRRMHIHDPGISNTTNAQLRISNVLSVASPVATDFRVTSAGNLYINNYGTEQRVGIEEPAPQERLDVAGNGRFQIIPNTTANCVILGKTVTVGVPQDNSFRRLDFNNNPNTYFAGNGTWQPASTAICDWNIVNNGGTNDLATGFTGACVERNVGVGISAPIAKLDVVRPVTTPAIVDPIGLRVTSTADAAIGGVGQDLVGLPLTNTNSFGTYSTSTTTLVTNASIGGYFKGSGGSTNNVGVYATFCSTSGSTTNYGLYASIPSLAGGGCSAGTNYAGFFNGPVNVQGPLTINGVQIFASDASIKKDIATMDGVTDKLLALNPVTYHLTNETCTNVTYETDLQCGLIAQEIAEVFPDMVEDIVIPNAMEGSEESLTIKGVQYTELIPVLIRGFQEQNKRIQNLEEQLAACCGAGMQMQGGNDGGNGTEKSTNITLSDKNTIVLNQNVPNPFAERTTISYNLPENVTKAQLLFYDNKGTLINAQDISTRGAGVFNVFASDLSSGSYSYALVVDGKIIDTKTMVKTK